MFSVSLPTRLKVEVGAYMRSITLPGTRGRNRHQGYSWPPILHEGRFLVLTVERRIVLRILA